MTPTPKPLKKRKPDCPWNHGICKDKRVCCEAIGNDVSLQFHEWCKFVANQSKLNSDQQVNWAENVYLFACEDNVEEKRYKEVIWHEK